MSKNKDSIAILKKRFMMFLVLFAIVLTLVVSIVSILTLEHAFDRFRTAENKEFVSVLADRLIAKTIFSFVFLILLISAIAIPFGLLFFKRISEVYLMYFQKITNLLLNRESAGSENKGSVEKQMEHLLNVLIQDQNKLKEYEKMNSWKDGVRMLLHELRNPLTPLKLTSQELLFDNSNEGISKEIESINESVTDIEKIIRIFQKIVNIKFEMPEELDFVEFIKGFKTQNKQWSSLNIFESVIKSHSICIIGETTLMKMLFTNLINNGLEANRDGFTVKIKETITEVIVDFITEDAHIESIRTIFKPGVSGKGDGRGYGLFLCKLISEYLDFNIAARNTETAVIFTIRINKIKD